MKNYFFYLFLIVLISCADRNKKYCFNASTTDDQISALYIAVSNQDSEINGNLYEQSLITKTRKSGKTPSLKNETEIENYLTEIDSFYRNFKLTAIKDMNLTEDTIIKTFAHNLGINKSFYKYDIDKNGHDDIITTGCFYWPEQKYCSFNSIALMNTGNEYVIKPLLKSHNSSLVPVIIPGNNTFLKIYNPPIAIRGYTLQKGYSTTLTYKFDNFIEYNPNPIQKNIQRIEFGTTPCYGTCPVFQIIIDKNRKAYYIAKYYNFTQKLPEDLAKEEGFFTTNLKNEDFNSIEKIINYLDFNNLKPGYSVYHTDAPSCLLKITYNDGKSKIINDYGLSGTYGLKILYALLTDLRNNQEWIKTDEIEGIRIKDLY
ncbi:DUF6438 domain-containing protein [Flavobacterium sp. C4GT6]|uniref:DUF6438 domain-containing protein n=1 Tax=Flavobacterium sp. C4GT6 TaxID=3103818 RepID=UPI002ED5E739